ncbi:MAG TPA: helix-turn-helix transcriptional regulator [Nostocaceae cyanobacterium]|nr:helix-turn-helix transcriptional regulator [Nostocaceae cyanobacterium]
MGRAGKALKQTLETYNISQNSLAVELGIERTKVFRWYHEQIDPTAETVAKIVIALNQINPSAAKNFIKLYLGELVNQNDENILDVE